MAAIHTWNEDDRPREKLMNKGVEALSNSELLAILINNGTKDESAVDVCKNLLSSVNNDIIALSKLSVKQIINLKTKGIGPAKAVIIAAALEFGVRRNMAETKQVSVTKAKDIAAYLRAQLQHKNHEVFTVLYLNISNKILHHEISSEGGITGTVADPRIILRKALEHEAVNIVLCHNHPSGSLKPSRQDEELTQKIKEAAKFFDIRVMDHLIVSDEGYFSFADDGIL